jgi:hypothetical protein
MITHDQEPEPEDDIFLLRRRLELKKKQLAMAKAFGLMFYKPHSKQALFHQAALFRFRLGRCGNRFGKSDMGVSEDLAFALGERVWLSKDDPMRYLGIPKHATKGLVVCADDDKVDEIFTGNGSKGHVGKIWKKIPKDLIVGQKRGSSGTIINLRIKGLYGESVIDFDTRSAFKNNPMGSESSDYDWCHVDEPIEEAHWKAILRGLTDRGGKAWFTCTLIEQPWINDMFFGGPDDSSKEMTETITESGRKVKWSITGSIYDNPYLSADDIEDFLNALTDDEKQCRIHGIPLHLSGVIYKEFERHRHVLSELPPGWLAFNDPPRDYTIHFAIDPHPRTPHAVLFIAVSPHGRAYVYDEIFHSCTTDELAKLILAKIAGRHVWTKIMDPMAWIEDQRTRSMMADDFAKFGLFGLEKAPKDLVRGIPEVKRLMKLSDFLYVSPMCRTFLWELGRYAWDDRQGTPTNKPRDKDDHMMECLYRLCLRGLDYYDADKMTSPVEEMSISGDMDDDQFGSLTL